MARTGLSAAEALERLRRFGPNETGEGRGGTWRRALAAVAGEPMFLLLLAAGAIYLVVGDLAEGVLLAFFALVAVGLVVLQQERGERALDALRALAVPEVRVLREGRAQRIPARELVPGDLLLLGEGERVAADAVLREATGVQVDESLLTGESVPVRKRAAVAGEGEEGGETKAIPGGEDAPHVFAGTLVVSGHALAEVLATGERTHMGRIGLSLARIDTRATPLQSQLARLARRLFVLALVLSLALVAWHGLAGQGWLQSALWGLAFAMAMLPEEVPMVLTIFVGLAAWRMARLQVLARRPAVIEALGATTVLCVDKTGTLTENRQRLCRLLTAEDDIDVTAGAPLPESVHELLEYALMASRRGGADPLDLAVFAHGDASLAGTEHLHPAWPLLEEYPLTPELLATSQSWVTPQGRQAVAAKGAVEAVADLCHLDAEAAARLLRQAEWLASQGLRVLAVAKGEAEGAKAAAIQHDYTFTPLGLLAFEDPLRADVPAAVAQARAAGIGVAMITGDHLATALAVARQAGIATDGGALTGAEVDALDDAGLRAALRQVRVFARTLPQHKLRLVQAFRANGETVAMTGDGVNDAPALKAADIGIAMGVRGTDVAREAAGLVLLDEDFSRIVAGIRAGRRTFDNLRRALTYILAIHVPIAGLALLPVVLGWPPVLLPPHVALIQMVVDPMCSFAFEGVPQSPELMRRPPRPARQALLGTGTLRFGLLQGSALLLAALAVYAVALRFGSADAARTLAVAGLTAGNVALVWINTGARIGRPLGRALPIITALAALAMAVTALVPPLRALFQFGPAPPLHWALALVLPVAAVALAAALGTTSPPPTAAPAGRS
ncbi:MAG: cation-translocating P-type ATPase [Burkholderiales bacterium]|nr:cation-translocating P-type ATPase [Burkholderiales bacterium]